MSNSRGNPLALSAPAGRAPLAVNQATMVKNLNTEYTGGLTAAQLQPTGGVGTAHSPQIIAFCAH